jgi:hypothetical protein
VQYGVWVNGVHIGGFHLHDQSPLIEEVICLSFLDSIVLQTRMAPMRPFFGGFIIEVAFAVSMLMVSVGILYVLIRLGS